MTNAVNNDRGVLEAILQRKTAAKFRDDTPPREHVEQLLEAAVQAPNHHLNQPWRFFVLAGKARDAYGSLLRDRLAARLPDPTTTEATAMLNAEARKPLRSPIVIVVASIVTNDPKALRHEDAAATSAAINNILLSAPAFGLSAYWRTGAPATDVVVKRYFRLQPEDEIVGIVYLGYPEVLRAVKPRSAAALYTTWLDDGESTG